MSPLLKDKKTEKNNLKKYCFISGILAAVIMIFTYLVHSQSLFFGDATVLRMDLYHQYGPLYAELYDRIVNGYSLIYSWTSGLGGAFLGNLFNYCCSPFAFIILLFGHKNMPEAIAVMILLKAVFSSVSFTYYLNKSLKRTHKASIAFGLLYAFCSFFVAYSWNIMWMDAMSVFPLVILGIEQIIENRKPFLFIFALTYTMITNYYMAYMVCVLSVLYFIFYYFGRYSFKSSVKEETAEPAKKEETDAAAKPSADDAAPVKKKKNRTKLIHRRFLLAGLMFAGSGILCFMLSAFSLLPVAYCLQASSATSSAHNVFPEQIKIYFNFFDFIANHFPSVEPTIRSSGENVLPNVYCGVITLLLIPFYFMSEKISGRKKIMAVVFIGVFYVSFSVNSLNFMWHGFHFPNDLPYRFSFAYSFLLLRLAYEALLHIREFSKRQYVAVGIALVLFAVFVDKIGSKNVDRYAAMLAMIFGIVYVVIYGMNRSPRYNSRSVASLLIFAVVLELCFANSSHFVMQQSKKNYTGDYDAYQSIRASVEANETELFYRTELSHLRARMDPCWYGYNGVSTFSSMAYEKTSETMNKLGLFGNNINSYTYNPQTPVFNSMFSLRYIYDNSKFLSNGEYYTYLGEAENFRAFRYEYFLPLAFTVSAGVKDWDLSSSNPFDVQNDLFAKAAGSKDVLKKVNATDYTLENLQDISLDFMNEADVFSVNKLNSTAKAKLKLFIEAQEDGNYYVYAGSSKLESMHVTANSFNYNFGSSGIDPLILDVGPLKKGDQITVEYNIDSSSAFANITFCAARIDTAAFKRGYNQLKRGAIQLTTFSDTEFTGNVSVKNKNSFLFTSIPYDESWEILVDGTALAFASEKDLENGTTDGKIIPVGNSFLGFDLAQGEHTLEFRYRPRGLVRGLELTAAGVVLLLIVIAIAVFLKKKREEKALRETVPVPEPVQSAAQGPNSPVWQETREIPSPYKVSSVMLHEQQEMQAQGAEADAAPGTENTVPAEETSSAELAENAAEEAREAGEPSDAAKENDEQDERK